MFHIWTTSGHYLEKHECITKEALDSRDKILDCKNETKLKYDDFLIVGVKWIWVHNFNKIGVLDFNTLTQIFQAWLSKFPVWFTFLLSGKILNIQRQAKL